MAYELKYHPAAVKKTDLPKISRRYRETIKRVIEERLATKPEIFGKPLQRTLRGYWKMRVGDYRIVYKVSRNSIRVFGIIYRKEVYKRIKNAPSREEVLDLLESAVPDVPPLEEDQFS